MITYGKANGIRILVGEKLGFPISAHEKELAVILYQEGEIGTIEMGLIDSCASRIHNMILADNMGSEAQELANKMLE
jgi:hypothetical protein